MCLIRLILWACWESLYSGDDVNVMTVMTHGAFVFWKNIRGKVKDESILQPVDSTDLVSCRVLLLTLMQLPFGHCVGSVWNSMGLLCKLKWAIRWETIHNFAKLLKKLQNQPQINNNNVPI